MTAGDAIFCCTQESRVFTELSEELGWPRPLLDLRDRAGWSDDPASKLPKMSALASEALLNAPLEKSLDVTSEGLCLILGTGEAAVQAAHQLKDHLAVTLLTDPSQPLPDTRAFDVIGGTLRKAKGALGHFEVTIDALRQVVPGGRGELTYTAPQDGAISHCDVILDMRGQQQPLFPPTKNARAICAPIRPTRVPSPPPCWPRRIWSARLNNRCTCAPNRCCAPTAARGKPPAPTVWTCVRRGNHARRRPRER